jgi:acetyltransferase-like isoleucine patch superfamily enzyme
MVKSVIRNMIIPFVYKRKFRKSTISSDLGNSPLLDDPVYIGENVTISQSVTVGRYTCVMEFTQISSNCDYIGRYCSIARGCVIGTNHHPYHFLTTSSVFYTKVWGIAGVKDRKKEMNAGKKTTIGHDVWIGTNSIIMGGVDLGTGSIVGAGSIVTKDVPPYSIVVGSPARIIKYRFDEQVIAKLLKSCWWELPENKLIPYWDDVTKFLDEI